MLTVSKRGRRRIICVGDVARRGVPPGGYGPARGHHPGTRREIGSAADEMGRSAS